jgi:diguanylate cyclase (GGDEF)-like protein/PAS domain S-box-containing protein
MKFKTNEQLYKSLYQQNPDLILTIDVQGNILSSNKVAEKYGYSQSEIINKSFTPHIVPEELELNLQKFLTAISGKSVNYESAILSKNGDRFEVSITSIPIIIKNSIKGVFVIIKDITSLKKAQHALIEAEAQYRNLAEESLVGTYMIQDGKIMYVNRKAIEMLGYSNEQEVIGSSAMNFVHPDDRELVTEMMNKRLSGEIDNIHYQYRAIRKDHTVIHMEVHGAKTIYKEKPAVIGTLIDITSRKKAEATIEYMAYHDSLTGLFNRNHIYKQLRSKLEDESVNSLAVIFFDLDRFKQVNDSLGHRIGDSLLKLVSKRLKEQVFTNADFARNGGDEFIVFLPNVTQQEVEKVADLVLHSFVIPFEIDQYELYITPSIGISLYPEDGQDVDTLIKKADSAMYQAKRGGKNNYQFYSSNKVDHTYERLEIETDLRKALEQNEFELYYQPKLHLGTGQITGVEALIRWKHPEKGLISPAQFIPLAEETGLIIPIGEWTLRHACLQNKAWQEDGISPIVMSVNLSVRQLYQPNLVEMIRNVLIETELDPRYLELEITESMLMDTEHCLKILRELKGLGLKISLDDFGTGYSSLHYLKDIPINKLKIDQSFVRNCTEDANDAAIVKTIIGMAHQLNLEVVAEGVETQKHLAFLQHNLCNEAQGYLFSKPLPPNELVKRLDDIEELLNQHGTLQ